MYDKEEMTACTIRLKEGCGNFKKNERVAIPHLSKEGLEDSLNEVNEVGEISNKITVYPLNSKGFILDGKEEEVYSEDLDKETISEIIVE